MKSSEIIMKTKPGMVAHADGVIPVVYEVVCEVLLYRLAMEEECPMNAEIDFPSLVKRIRTAGDLTQEQLAHELGVTFGTVNGWENRKHRPSPLAIKGLVRLAVEMGLTLEGTDETHRNVDSTASDHGVVTGVLDRGQVKGRGQGQ